jgi:hypothetical protein
LIGYPGRVESLLAPALLFRRGDVIDLRLCGDTLFIARLDFGLNPFPTVFAYRFRIEEKTPR